MNIKNKPDMNTKRFKTTVGSMLTAMFALCIISCSEEDERMESVQPDATERKAYVAEMKFESGVPTFGEQTNETRAYTDAWENGARLYLQFYNGSARVDGLAVYSSATDSWTVNYYGTIVKGQEATCEVYYFENPGAATNESVTLTPETAVFADKAGRYLYENGTVTLSAQLAAQTGRLRWKGSASQEFTFTGLTCHTKYDILNNTLSTQETDITQTVSSNGYSPYVYGSFTSDAKLTVESDGDDEVAFSKTFDASVLAKGKSGFINVPTMASRNGWTLVTPETTKSFTVNGVTFTMERVKKGTFTMGATSEQTGAANHEKPTHNVTLTKSYYLGTYEVTQELYQAVMGSNPSYYKGNKKPVTDVSWNNCQTFITKLNSLTGLTFRLPTEAEWEFAARGGNETKGYLYSGSNNIGDVAYYGKSSGGPTEVGEYNPNELGIYDMSGNVWEWCQDWYGSYSSGSQTDSTGPTSGSDRVLRGGSWFFIAAGCRVARRYNHTPTYADNSIGFRLALSSSH